jgi:hypothetical protein
LKAHSKFMMKSTKKLVQVKKKRKDE